MKVNDRIMMKATGKTGTVVKHEGHVLWVVFDGVCIPVRCYTVETDVEVLLPEDGKANEEVAQ